MGPPPQYLIQRKLVRSILKKVIPKNPLIPKEYFESMSQCWRKYGVGNARCLDQELMFDFAQSQTLGFRQKIQKLGIKNAVTSQLKRPIYPSQSKGRHYQHRLRNKANIQFNTMI